MGFIDELKRLARPYEDEDDEAYEEAYEPVTRGDRAARREKGFSQQELADRLHVVRQTVSKWEGGLSAPDAELLATLAGVLEVPVGRLLGEEEPPEEVEAVSARLAELEGRAARRRETVRRLLHGLCLAVCLGVLAGFLLIGRPGSSPQALLPASLTPPI